MSLFIQEEALEYVVQPGDCILSIASKHGFLWQTLWNANPELKARRDNPNVIFPGDLVQIPQKVVKEASCVTDQLHKFAKKGTLAKFRVIVGEFHGLETLTEPDRFQLICQAFERLTANHVVTHVHPNNNGGIELVEGIVVPRILEITFLRRDRAKFIADHQPIPTPLDYANVAWKREIVMTPFD